MLFSRLPLLLAVIMGLLISGSLYWQLMPFYEAYQSQSLAAVNNSTSALNTLPTQEKKSHNIASFMLFGDSKVQVKKTVIDTQSLPKTTLNLTLTGVLVSDDPTAAGALIQGPKRQTINYKIGDELPGGAILKQVLDDRVIVERGGRLENLVFVESRSIGISNYSYINEDSPILNTSAYNSGNITPPGFPSTTSAPLTPARTLSIKERLSKLRKRLLRNRP